MKYNFSNELYTIVEAHKRDSVVLRLISGNYPENLDLALDYIGLDPANSDQLTFLASRDKPRVTRYHYWENERRASSKIGRIVRTLIPETFRPLIHDSEIEKAVNIIKAELVAHVGVFHLEAHDQIGHWYHEAQICKTVAVGALGSSCMRYAHYNPGITEFYTAIGNQVRILTLRNGSDKLLGRALVWTTTKGDTVLDRVYASDSNVRAFNKYGKEQGWYTRQYNTYSNSREWIDPNGDAISKTFNINLPKDPPSFFPYMDSFKYIDYEKLLMHNSPNKVKQASLERTDGTLEYRYNETWNGNTYISGTETVINNWREYHEESEDVSDDDPVTVEEAPVTLNQVLMEEFGGLIQQEAERQQEITPAQIARAEDIAPEVDWARIAPPPPTTTNRDPARYAGEAPVLNRFPSIQGSYTLLNPQHYEPTEEQEEQ